MDNNHNPRWTIDSVSVMDNDDVMAGIVTVVTYCTLQLVSPKCENNDNWQLRLQIWQSSQNLVSHTSIIVIGDSSILES